MLSGVTFTPTLNYNANFNIATSVSDGVAAPVTGSKLMTGTPQNDAPTATNLSQGETYIEDTPLNLVDIVVSDVDSSTATVTLTISDASAGALSTATSGLVTSTYNAVTGVWTASGAIADVNTLLSGVTFTPMLNYNANFNIATSVSDGVAAPVTGSKLMTGTPQNDAPTITDLAGDTLAYTEGSGAQVVDQSTILSVGDVDSANFDGGDITVSISGGGVASEDVLGVLDVGNGAGQIGFVAYTETVLDDFNPNGYSGNDGTQTWVGGWQEYGDSGGSSGGSVRVTSNQLRMGGDEVSLNGRRIRSRGRPVFRESRDALVRLPAGEPGRGWRHCLCRGLTRRRSQLGHSRQLQSQRVGRWLRLDQLRHF